MQDILQANLQYWFPSDSHWVFHTACVYMCVHVQVCVSALVCVMLTHICVHT